MLRRVGLRGTALNLYNTDTNGKEEESQPLGGTKFPAKKHNRKDSRSKDLHLIADLESRSLKVGHGDELEIILYN